MGPADVPPLALAIGIQHERALTRADQYPYTAHRYSLPAAAGRGPPARSQPGHGPARPLPASTGLSRLADVLTAASRKTHRPSHSQSMRHRRPSWGIICLAQLAQVGGQAGG